MEETNNWDEIEEREGPEETETAAPTVRAEVRGKLCRKIAQRCLRDHRIVGPPVPVDTIARNLGYELQALDLRPGVDARLQIID